MKTLLKLWAAALLAAAPLLAAQAAPPPAADLTVVATRGQLFTLALDGRLLTGAATRQVHVGWLAPGQHWADVRVFSPYGPPIGFRAAVWLQPGLDSRYVLAISPYGPRLEAVGTAVPGGPGSYGGYYGRGSYGGIYGNAPGAYGGTPGIYGNAPGPYGTVPDGSYPNGTGYPAPGLPQGSYSPPAQAPGGAYGAPEGGYAPPSPAPDGNYTQPGQGGYAPSPNGAYPDTTSGTLAPLAPADVRDLAQELREQSSDEARLDITRQALEGSSLQASELSELLEVFTAEQARIELTELGYSHLSDPANVNQVYARLRPASVAEVQRRLGLQRTY